MNPNETMDIQKVMKSLKWGLCLRRCWPIFSWRDEIHTRECSKFEFVSEAKKKTKTTEAT